MIDKDLVQYALVEADKFENSYVDVKFLERKFQQLLVKNDILEQNQNSISNGIGIKFLVDGAFGFASTNVLTKQAIKSIVKRAYRVAKASAITMKKPIQLAEEPAYEDTIVTPIKEDPEFIDQEELISELTDATKACDIGDPRIKIRSSTFSYWKDRMVLYTSEGTKIDQTIIACGSGINVIAIEGKDTQARGYPGGMRGNIATAGFEYHKELDILGHADGTAKEAISLLESPHCPAKDKATVIILPGQLMLQLHENGHGFEMDRAYDYEAAFAGTSFIKPHLINKLKWGNELITIYGDATHPKGLGTFFYDHEGVKAQKTKLVDKGVFVGYLSSRETAPLQGWERSSGTARATAFDRMPLIRMTNINLEPGDWDYQELIEDTKDGYVMDTNVSWSIDDLRLSFQFGTEIGWRIEKGEVTGLVKNPSYTGITPKFWNSCTGVANDKFFKMYGTPNCGKGEPSQVMYTGHGSSPARFENVRIGVVQV
jgi:TldD protein